jgi:hypothetical protein
MNWFKVFSLALMAGVCLSPFPICADLEVSADLRIHSVADFEAPLALHGTWGTMGNLGRCWRPAHIALDWRPYCNGYWEWTDLG